MLIELEIFRVEGKKILKISREVGKGAWENAGILEEPLLGRVRAGCRGRSHPSTRVCEQEHSSRDIGL